MHIDFSNGKVLVIGDLMLDRYYFGSVNRISPEAPVPVVKVKKASDTLGGAGNVANNLAHLGSKVTVIGTTGKDENSGLIGAFCRKNAIRLSAIQTSLPTITKIRVIGEHQQVVRVDFEEEFRFTPELLSRVKKTILRNMAYVKVVVLSDYGKGFCSKDLCAFVIREASKRKIAVVVDPKGHDWTRYRGATIVTPNVKELGDVVGFAVGNTDEPIASHAKKIVAAYRLGSLLVTRSEKGMSLVSAKEVTHVPTEAREVFDVSGAGDTVVATLAAALASGYPLPDAVILANKAAGIVVAKIGTVPVTHRELRAVLDYEYNPKLLTGAEVVRQGGLLKKQGKKIVFANGCFDILHRGHVHLLQKAKQLGDCLIVALNSDASCRTIKGPGFPLNNEKDRAHLIAALGSVDYITVFNEPSPLALIRRLKPDFIIKGGNYRTQEVVGHEFAGKTVIIPELAGYSTGKIAKKIPCG
jgi:D-beta-D-heptose 7-phosphate kinase / D-beta-D-heptose 1-phosphate adenosyltransferase